MRTFEERFAAELQNRRETRDKMTDLIAMATITTFSG